MHPVHGTQFVSIRIANVCEIQGPQASLARAGWRLDRGAAIGNCRIVEGVHLLG